MHVNHAAHTMIVCLYCSYPHTSGQIKYIRAFKWLDKVRRCIQLGAQIKYVPSYKFGGGVSTLSVKEIATYVQQSPPCSVIQTVVLPIDDLQQAVVTCRTQALRQFLNSSFDKRYVTHQTVVISPTDKRNFLHHLVWGERGTCWLTSTAWVDRLFVDVAAASSSV